MGTIRDQAKQTESATTKNICELKSVSTETDIKVKTVSIKNGEDFSYNYILVDKQEYRVPKTVLKQLKEQLKTRPSCTKFKVTKSGEGMKTEYFVVLLE